MTAYRAISILWTDLSDQIILKKGRFYDYYGAGLSVQRRHALSDLVGSIDEEGDIIKRVRNKIRERTKR